MHNIEREIVFRNNDKLVAHDSEGFEAGQSSENHVVNDFIERRVTMENINDRLHMVWYEVFHSRIFVVHQTFYIGAGIAWR